MVDQYLIHLVNLDEKEVQRVAVPGTEDVKKQWD